MIEVAELIAEMAQSGNVLWLAFFAVVALLSKVSKIVEFFESRKKAKIFKLIDASSCEYLDANFKEFLSQEIQKEYFFYVSRIDAEKQYRDKLFEVHKYSNGDLPFSHFKRASSHLRFKDGKISVKITAFDTLGSLASMGAAFLFGFVGLALFMLPAIIKPLPIVQFITFYGMGALFVVMAGFFALQTLPMRCAKQIRKELEKQAKQTNGGLPALNQSLSPQRPPLD